MEWFKVYGNLKEHPKRWRFEAKAGTEYGLHYLTAFWCYVCRYAEDGSLSGVGHAELARACEWKGDAEVFWAALVHAGFIDDDGEMVVVHDWAEIHERFLNENARRKAPKGYPRVTQGLPVLEEKRREEIKTPKSVDGFEEFWMAYPRKTAKQDALKAWASKKPPLDKCLSALVWQKQSLDWTKDGGKFVPYPASWINAGRWMDEQAGQSFDPMTHHPDGRKKNIL